MADPVTGPEAAPVVSAASRPNGVLAKGPGRKESVTNVPSTSSRRQPNAASAPPFHSTTVPPRSISTKASGHPATRRRAAGRRRRSSARPGRAGRPWSCGSRRRGLPGGPRQPSEFVDHQCALQPAPLRVPGTGVAGQSRQPERSVQGPCRITAVAAAVHRPATPVAAGGAIDGRAGRGVYRACRGRGDGNRPEAGVGGQHPAPGGTGAPGAVVHPGAHSGQSAALRAGVRPRARRRRGGHRRRRLGHRRGLGRPHLGPRARPAAACPTSGPCW